MTHQRAIVRARRIRSCFTLVEVLLAMALTSSVVVALFAMIGTVGLARATLAEELRWRMSAEQLLQCVHDEVASGWRPDSSSPVLGPRVRCTLAAVSIRIDAAPGGTRSPRVVSYTFDESRFRLVRATRDGDGAVRSSTALGDVAELSVAASSRSLTIGVRSVRGLYVERVVPFALGSQQ